MTTDSNRTLIIAQSKVVLAEPHDCTDIKDVQNVLSALFDSLVAHDTQLNYVPALATSWQVSDDARTWTFTLRPDVTFHNGQPVDAEAVVYSLARMARPDMGVTLGAPGVYNQYLAGMKLKIINRHAVEVTLPEPMADLLDVLVTGYILPPDELEKRGSDFSNNPVGTGPYRFAAYEKGRFIRAEKNEAYFGAAPTYDAIEWKMVPDPQQRLQMTRDRQADIATGPPYPAHLDESIDFVSSRGTTAYILIFNMTSELLKDPRVRVAINMGVNRAALIDKVLNGAGFPLNGFISPVHFGHDPESGSIAYDPAQARRLLAEAGFSNGIQLTLDSPLSMPDEAVRLSETLAVQLAEIGVEIDIVYTEDREDYANKVRLKDIQDLCVFDSSPLSTFRVIKEKIDSRFEGSWWQGYSNIEVQKLLDNAQTTVDNQRRESMYRKCYQLLRKNPPWLYLYNYKLVTCTSADLSGWTPPAHNIIDPRYL